VRASRQKGSLIFTPEQYREKAAGYAELARHGNTPHEVHEFQTHERSLTMLADNKQWLADNDDKLADNLDEMAPVLKHSGASKATLAGKGAYPAMPGGGADHGVEHVADGAAKGPLR
jgi:hypothetical protein